MADNETGIDCPATRTEETSGDWGLLVPESRHLLDPISPTSPLVSQDPSPCEIPHLEVLLYNELV